MAQWHVKVATSVGLVERAGTSYVERKTISDPVHNHTHFFPNKNNLLTCAKRQDRRIGAEQARMDTWELKTSFSSGCRGGLFARFRWHDAVDVQRFARVFTVRDSVVDQSPLQGCLFVIPGSLENSTFVSVLSCCAPHTRQNLGCECVSPVYPCQHHAEVVANFRRPRSAAFNS